MNVLTSKKFPAKSKRFYRSTVAKYPKSTTVNKPIKRLYQKAKVQPKKAPAQNKQAIMKLSKQVKTLQNQRYGEIQSHTQHVLLQTTNLPTSTQPIAFILNDFYDQSIFKGTNVGGIANYTLGPAFARQTYQSDLNDQYEWNARRNTDAVSQVEYKPVYTRLRLSFDVTMAGLTYPGKIRITILKIKPYESSNKLSVNLPAALGAYRYLAERDYDSKRNYFDKKYHQIVYDKWLTFKGTNNTGSETTVIRKGHIISWRFNDMVLRPDITNNPPNQTFWTNIPVSQQYWVLISADDYMNTRLQGMEIGKFDVWRDPHGV